MMPRKSTGGIEQSSFGCSGKSSKALTTASRGGDNTSNDTDPAEAVDLTIWTFFWIRAGQMKMKQIILFS